MGGYSRSDCLLTDRSVRPAKRLWRSLTVERLTKYQSDLGLTGRGLSVCGVYSSQFADFQFLKLFDIQGVMTQTDRLSACVLRQSQTLVCQASRSVDGLMHQET